MVLAIVQSELHVHCSTRDVSQGTPLWAHPLLTPPPLTTLCDALCSLPGMQYYVGNQSTATTTIEPLTFVSGLNDEDYLIDHFEGLLQQSVQQGKPFLAVIFFHGVHIPYVATPTTRAKYAARGMDENEQDYWGTIEQIDGAVGRVRRLLAAAGTCGWHR